MHFEISSSTGQSRWEDSWRGCFLNIEFQWGIYCAPILGTRTARASRTKAADGFPAPMDYFVFTGTWAIKGVIRREMHVWETNRKNAIVYNGKYSQKIYLYRGKGFQS